MCPSIYFWPYLSCQHLNSPLHSWWSCYYCMILYRFPWDAVEYHFFIWSKKNWLKDLVLMHNYLVVIQQFDKICFCCRGMQKAALSQLHCKSLLASYDNLVSQTCYLTSRRRDVNCKICEIEEVTKIYCDKERGGAIAEECERKHWVICQKRVQVWR